jgi:hypothetical protein
MSPSATLAIFGFIPVVLYLFSAYEGRKAAAAAFILGWLFLPVANIPVPAISTFGKIHTICFSILLGAMVFDSDRLSNFTLSSIDLPIIAFCFAPVFASLSNGLGLYDGVAAMRDQTISWGLPYFVGRIYLTNLEEVKDLALLIFIGGLIYIPFCLFEIRMSPQLHMRVYGFYQFDDFSQSLRAGGYRPLVFMNHGIMVGMWMAMASLIGVWLYYTGVLQETFGSKSRNLLIGLLLVTVAVKSFGALVLLIIGVAVLFLTKLIRKPILVLLICLIPVLYLTARISGMWNGESLVEQIAKMNEERAESLRFRLENENILLDKARQAPVFGWGGWGRARVYNEEGEDISVTDGQWIIVLGNLGIYGLATMTASILLPVFLLVIKIPASRWADAEVAPAAVLAIALAMYMIDSLPNAMPNPTFMFIAGGLSSLYEASPAAIFSQDEEEFDEFEAEAPPIMALTPKTRFI